MGKSKNMACIILAAGRGTRLKSDSPKVLHRISGKTMIEYIMELIKPFGFKPVVVIVGYKGDEVAKLTKDAKVVYQKQLLGSADAVRKAEKALKGFGGNTLILYGDAPLITRETLKKLIYRHKTTGASCTLLTARMEDPREYGRILRNANGDVENIVEETEVPLYDRAMNEVNVGPCCFDVKALFGALDKVKINARKKEFYLTDVVSILSMDGKKIESSPLDCIEEALGINSRGDLAMAEKTVRERAINKFLDNGVTIIDPKNTYIDVDCRIGKDTIIYPNVVISGGVKIGENCVIGPFSRIRPGTVLSDRVEIGNFVELTRSTVGSDTKIKHLSYIGDAVIGKDVNIGAGTITANYDGKVKNKTVIKDKAFVGSGSIFVAPVTVGKGVVTGAGAVVTKNTKMPDGSVFVGIPARLLKKK
ncbi:MAG: NTP transferase domain-containing protein [Candidatus Omnitrophica bacterium]|nr:NTP transferase domain-containing protein [Candidatus Omnitrophota bacterium]